MKNRLKSSLVSSGLLVGSLLFGSAFAPSSDSNITNYFNAKPEIGVE